MTVACRSIRSLAWLLPLGPLAAEEPRPSFEKLVELNSRQLFGGEAHLEGDRVTIHFKRPSQFERGFEGQGILNADDIKGLNRKILEKPGGGEIPEVAGVGRSDGDWLSRFKLAEDIKVSFKLRIPAIQHVSQLMLSINKSHQGSIQTSSFFQGAALVVGGKTRKRVAAPKEFQGPPEKWFDRKALVPVVMSYKDGKFSLRVKDAEVLSMDEAGEAQSGRIGFSFRKLSLVVSELVISGKIDRAWCEGQLKELEAKGALALREKPSSDGASSAPPRRSRKKDAEDREARKKEAQEEL